MSAGTYLCYVNSAIGCSDTLSIVIPEGLGVDATNQVVLDESCYGESDGSFQFDVTTLNPPFIMSWGGDTISTQQLYNISPGNYDLIITDSIGCTYDSLYTINAVSSPLDHSVSTTPVTLGADGEAILNATGGTPPYQYSIGSNYQSSNTFSGLLPGSYISIVMDSNGCTDTVLFNIDSELSLSKSSFETPKIYPNPVNDLLTVKLLNNKFDLSIYDLQGRIVHQSTNNESKMLVSVKDFSEGLYSLVLSSEGQDYHFIFSVY